MECQKQTGAQVFGIVFLTPCAIHLLVVCYEQEDGCDWRSGDANLQEKTLSKMSSVWSSDLTWDFRNLTVVIRW